MEKARNNPSMATGESQEQEGGFSGNTKRKKKKVHFATLMDICHLEKSELERKFHKNTKDVLYSEVTL